MMEWELGKMVMSCLEDNLTFKKENWIDLKENELILKVLGILYNYTDGSFYTNMLQSF